LVSVDARNREYHITLNSIRLRTTKQSRKYLSFTRTKILDVATDKFALEDRIWPPLLLHGVLNVLSSLLYCRKGNTRSTK
jgi:hypothetical protein